MTRLRVLGLIVAASLLLPGSVAGQTVGASTGAISGTVRDDSGAALSDVTIVLTSPVLMGVAQAVTNIEGFYRFLALPPGEYALVFTRTGFGSARREGLHTDVGFTATVDAVLSVAQEVAVTVVPTLPAVDRHATAIATNFDAGQLGSVPGSRSFLALLSATPAVHVGRIEVGGNNGAVGGLYSAYGTAGANQPVIEGINVSGIALTGFVLNYGSFTDVSVGTAAHSAEWPMPGVQMQFVSHSGGNRYRGSFYADYEDRDWQSFNIDGDQLLRGAAGASGLPPREANRLSSYYDFNADVGGFIKRDAIWWYSSFREQDVSARQVNLPDTPYRTHLSNYSGKLTSQVSRNNKLVAFAQVSRNHQPTRLDPFGPAATLNPSTVINQSAEATTDHLAWSWVWKGEWNSLVRSNLLFDVRAGQFAGDRSETPNGAADRFEDVATFVVRGGNRNWRRQFHRNQLAGSLSYFKDGWLGTHHVKVGGQVVRTTEVETWNSSYPRDVLHVLRRGEPLDVYLFQPTPSMASSGLWLPAAHITDYWALHDRLTFNLGLRFDRYQIFLPAQQHVMPGATPLSFPSVDNLIAWNLLAPRLGATYSLSDGGTLIKFSYGRYWFPPGTELGFNANPNASLWWSRYPWVDGNRNGAWDEGEENRSLVFESRGGIEQESLDPGLELPYLTELATRVERTLPGSVVLRTGIVWRGERRHYMRQNVNQPFDAFSVPVSIRDPGVDGALGTSDDGTIAGYELRQELVGQTGHIVRNVADSDSSYLTWEAVVTRRFSGRWSLVAGFAHTWSRDQANVYSGQPVRQNTYPLNPNDLINAGEDGRYAFGIWSAKLFGTYDAPGDVRVTPLLRHQSGQPFGRTFVASLNYGNIRVLAEPIGTRRMDHLTIFDIRVEKGFTFGAGRRLAGFVDVFNILNTNAEQTANWGSPNFLRPIVIVAPRIARVGMKLDW